MICRILSFWFCLASCLNNILRSASYIIALRDSYCVNYIRISKTHYFLSQLVSQQMFERREYDRTGRQIQLFSPTFCKRYTWFSNLSKWLDLAAKFSHYIIHHFTFYYSKFTYEFQYDWTMFYIRCNTNFQTAN